MCALLADHRLVTLAGPGGGGKTRLALQAADRMVGGFPDGVCWVELARMPPTPHQRRAIAATVRDLGAALPAEEVEAARADGARLTLDGVTNRTELAARSAAHAAPS